MATAIGQKLNWYVVDGKMWHVYDGPHGRFLCGVHADTAHDKTVLEHPVKPDGKMLCIECLRELNR